MEGWHIIYALAVIQALYVLVRKNRSYVDFLSPSTISALTLLIWFYPKVPDLATKHFLISDSIFSFLIFWLLCQTALFLGTNSRLPSYLRGLAYDSYQDDNYQSWIFFMWLFFIIGGLAFYRYTKLPPEMLYMRQPSGIITILTFFSTFLTIATIISAFVFLRTRRWILFIPLVIGITLYADRILIHGKRSELFEVMFLIALIRIVFQRKRIPLVIGVGAALIMFTFNAVVADYRAVTKKVDPQIRQLYYIPIKTRLSQVMFEADYDIINAVATFKAYRSSKQFFELGADYWNVVVQRYIPGQIVGRNVKESLRIRTGDALWSELQYIPPEGTTTFVPGGIFRNFGWLGFLPLFIYGVFMRFLFLGARERSIGFLVLYAYFGAMIPVVMIFGIEWFWGAAIFWVPLIFWVMKIASGREKNRKLDKRDYVAASN